MFLKSEIVRVRFQFKYFQVVVFQLLLRFLLSDVRLQFVFLNALLLSHYVFVFYSFPNLIKVVPFKCLEDISKSDDKIVVPKVLR